MNSIVFNFMKWYYKCMDSDYLNADDYDMDGYERQSIPATEAEADYEYACAVGANHPDSQWVLSDRDTWYKNPYYSGPPQRHPEDDSEADDAAPFFEEGETPGATLIPVEVEHDDECPF